MRPAVQSTATHEQLEEIAERERQLLREQIRLLERQVDDLKTDREKWQQQASAITRLLTDERASTEQARAEAQRAREEAEKAKAAPPTVPAPTGLMALFSSWKRGRAGNP